MESEPWKKMELILVATKRSGLLARNFIHKPYFGQSKFKVTPPDLGGFFRPVWSHSSSHL